MMTHAPDQDQPFSGHRPLAFDGLCERVRKPFLLSSLRIPGRNQASAVVRYDRPRFTKGGWRARERVGCKYPDVKELFLTSETTDENRAAGVSVPEPGRAISENRGHCRLIMPSRVTGPAACGFFTLLRSEIRESCSRCV